MIRRTNEFSQEMKSNLNKFKNEVANELGIDLTSPSLTAKDAGQVGGQMVKEMISKAKSNI